MPHKALLSLLIALISVFGASAETALPEAAPSLSPTLASDTIAIIGAQPEEAPGTLPAWLQTETMHNQLAMLGDRSHSASVAQFAVPAGVFATAALFVRTPALVRWRELVQDKLSNKGKDKTKIDDYLQYAPLPLSYALYFSGLKGTHNLADRTILAVMSYATFGVVNKGLKMAFQEKRPDCDARNSFPSGHTGCAFTGAELLRREYWDTNKWVAMSGYAMAATVGYLRIYNHRHWINDVVGGAALGYLSTTFAYWVYPHLFQSRTATHRDRLLQRLPSTNGRSERQLSWVAAPFASTTGYGVACSLTF